VKKKKKCKAATENTSSNSSTNATATLENNDVCIESIKWKNRKNNS
jgi:hypothetical protein